MINRNEFLIIKKDQNTISMSATISITQEDVIKAAQYNEHTMISTKDDDLVTSRITLLDAPILWKEDVTFFYYPNNRIAGSAMALHEAYLGALKGLPYYSSVNTQPGQLMAAEYSAEIGSIIERRKQTAKEIIPTNDMNPATTSTSTSTPIKIVPTPNSTTSTPNTSTLNATLNQAPVSELNQYAVKEFIDEGNEYNIVKDNEENNWFISFGNIEELYIGLLWAIYQKEGHENL